MEASGDWLETGGVASDADSDQDVLDDHKHNKLLDAISALDGKKRARVVQRSEPATQVSEFNVSKGKDQVRLHELMGSLKNTTSHGELKKQLNRIQKSQKVLSVPLSKIQQERIQRSVAYSETSKEVAKWDPVVEKNRKAEQLHFPLQKPNIRLVTTEQMAKRFQPRTPLEKEIATMLHGNENVHMTEKALTKAEERAMKAMSLQEARERRAELQKFRALMSYKETKARRQGKIKSKKYHRVLRKEREKKQSKELDELQRTDPDTYDEHIQRIEKGRVQERMSLKHKGGSRFMQKQTIYGKYDKHARQAVHDMLQKSTELKQKVTVESESDDDDDATTQDISDNPLEGIPSATKNPWMAPASAKLATGFKRPSPLRVDEDGEEERELADSVVGIRGDRPAFDKDDSQENERDAKDDDDINDDEGKVMQISNRDNPKIGSIKQDKHKLKRNNKPKKNKVKQIEQSDSESDDSDEEVIKRTFSNDEELNIDMLFEKVEQQSKAGKDENKSEQLKKRIQTYNKKSKKKRKVSAQTKKAEAVELSDDDDSSDLTSDEEDERRQKLRESLMRSSTAADGDLISESLTHRKSLHDLEGNWSDEEQETSNQDHVTSKTAGEKAKIDYSVSDNTSKGKEPQVDPKKVMSVEKNIKLTSLPSVALDEDGMEDTEMQQKMLIAEAFANDDVVDEFSAEKNAIKERDKPKDIDLTLPGWGDWGGTKIQVSKRKRRRFRIKAPPAPPRKDVTLDNVIISETKDNSIAKHQVNNLPFPFTNISQFEASIRAPIGKTWNTETSFHKLIKPKITTRKGVVIEPISKAETFKKSQKQGLSLAAGNDKQEVKGGKKHDRTQQKGKRKQGNQKKDHLANKKSKSENKILV